jgi:hypothetical protein
MADLEGQSIEAPAGGETIPSVVEPSVAESVVETPVEPVAVEEPVVETPAEPVAVEEPVVETPAEPVVETPSETPTEEPAAEVEAQAPEAPTYEEWKVPDGLTMDAEHIESFNSVIGKYGLSQEAGQELMEFGGILIKQAHEQMAQQQQEAFNSTRQNWVKEFERQAGNQRNTILNDARSVIKDAIPDDKARADLWEVLAYTGAGDHPAVINMLASIGKRSREGKAPGPSIASNISGNPADRRYERRG